MHCQKASELMSLRLDGRLNPEERDQLDEHIRDCPQCAEEWQSMLSLATLFADVEMAEPSPRLERKVMRQVRQHSWRTRLAKGMGLGMIGLLILSGIGVLVVAGAWSLSLSGSPLGRALVLVITQFGSTLRDIARAWSLMSQQALGGPIGLALLGGLVVTGMLTVQLLRMLARPVPVRA